MLSTFSGTLNVVKIKFFKKVKIQIFNLFNFEISMR